jgi:hypothetical protein
MPTEMNIPDDIVHIKRGYRRVSKNTSFQIIFQIHMYVGKELKIETFNLPFGKGQFARTADGYINSIRRGVSVNENCNMYEVKESSIDSIVEKEIYIGVDSNSRKRTTKFDLYLTALARSIIQKEKRSTPKKGEALFIVAPFDRDGKLESPIFEIIGANVSSFEAQFRAAKLAVKAVQAVHMHNLK